MVEPTRASGRKGTLIRNGGKNLCGRATRSPNRKETTAELVDGRTSSRVSIFMADGKMVLVSPVAEMVLNTDIKKVANSKVVVGTPS